MGCGTKNIRYSQLVENLDAANIQLTAEDIKHLNSLNLNLRVGVTFLVWCRSTDWRSKTLAAVDLEIFTPSVQEVYVFICTKVYILICDKVTFISLVLV